VTGEAKPLSLRAYARRRGVSAEAVSKAVASGRLLDSVVVVDGQRKIADPELADREWADNTRPRGEAAEPAPSPSRAAAAPDDEVPPLPLSLAKRAAADARRAVAQADLAELDVGERRGELVSAAAVRSDVESRYAIVRTKMLGVPSRVGQRLPELAARVAPVVEELIREALEELSDRSAAADDADE